MLAPVSLGGEKELRHCTRGSYLSLDRQLPLGLTPCLNLLASYVICSVMLRALERAQYVSEYAIPTIRCRPGWALVGDAGHAEDPFLAHGISDAFHDAELLADAIESGLAGRRP